MNGSYSNREILNVFRKRHPEKETLTTDDLAEALSVENRTAQNYVRRLEDEGHLVLQAEGKPNHWRLADNEPKEPVYVEELAIAKRRGNQALELGKNLFIVGIGVLAAAGLITSNHLFAEAFNIYLPVIDADAASTAVVVGVFGSLLFGGAFIARGVGFLLPKVVRWKIED